MCACCPSGLHLRACCSGSLQAWDMVLGGNWHTDPPGSYRRSTNPYPHHLVAPSLPADETLYSSKRSQATEHLQGKLGCLSEVTRKATHASRVEAHPSRWSRAQCQRPTRGLMTSSSVTGTRSEPFSEVRWEGSEQCMMRALPHDRLGAHLSSQCSSQGKLQPGIAYMCIMCQSIARESQGGLQSSGWCPPAIPSAIPEPLLCPICFACRQSDSKDAALALYAMLTQRFRLRVFLDAQVGTVKTLCHKRAASDPSARL